MILGEVVGRLWNDRQVGELEGRRFVVVRDAAGELIVAADLVEAAEGNVVLVACDDPAQALAGSGIDAAVVALVGGADHLDTLGVRSTAGAKA